MDTMRLPSDVLESIFLRLSVSDVAKARVVCRQWKLLLCSHVFLTRYGDLNHENWVALFGESGLNEGRVLVLYNATLSTWHRVALNFLPAEFTDVIAAVDGLLCVAGQINGKNIMCVCNPITRAYKILPCLHEVPSLPVAVMVRSNHKGYQCTYYQLIVLRGDAVAVYSSTLSTWVEFNTGLPYRPRSPVVCSGVIYGLQNMGSPWKSSWRLVYAKLGEGCKEVWYPLYRSEWGEILDILRQPRLLEAKECLLLVGGLKHSVASNLCSTFVILKLDLTTLEWCEAARMPHAFYKHFDLNMDFKIFGGGSSVYFSSKVSPRLVACDFIDGKGVWHWVRDCPVNSYQKTFFCKGFPFEPRLDCNP
ncbi:hypothetical protein KP509_13G091000 [Ceratopteris richardii]|nr:hypothetical protein KP509_13G091000 [Ceratopteris richardii]KAH7422112.1 hypothetical protein KP509_13G091000 [Ceratopteris richardii]KAH7422113.1 hypothetical protein KP509_13G091000 [Ceratopteris richardii]